MNPYKWTEPSLAIAWTTYLVYVNIVFEMAFGSVNLKPFTATFQFIETLQTTYKLNLKFIFMVFRFKLGHVLLAQISCVFL